jgi:ribosomal protein S11
MVLHYSHNFLFFLRCSRLKTKIVENIFRATVSQNKHKGQLYLSRRFHLYFLEETRFFKLALCLSIKNLLKLFKKRRTKAKNRRFSEKCLLGWRLKMHRWLQIKDNSVSSLKFNLPFVKGSMSSVKSFEREDIVLELLHGGLEDLSYNFFYNTFFKYNFQMFCVRFFERRKLFLKGRLFITRIRTTRNNIFLTFSFINGKTLITMSAGRSGFTGKKKRTPLAARKTATRFAKKVTSFLEKHFRGEALFFINLKGPVTSALFKESLLAFKEEQLPCNLIVDRKSVAHSRGLRLKKPRRV